MIPFLTQGLLLGGTAAAQPGPFQAYLLSQTLKNGWRRTFWTAFAPLMSDGPIVLLVLLILTQTPDWFLILLRLAGGGFLLYLAWGAYKSFRDFVIVQPNVETGKQTIFEAALMNALSPNPYIFWATIAGPILIEGWRLSPSFGISFLLGFYGTLVGGFVGFIAIFAIARQLDPRFSRLLSGFSAIVLFVFAIYQLYQGISALIW